MQVDSMVDDGNIVDGALRIAFNGTGLLLLFCITTWTCWFKSSSVFTLASPSDISSLYSAL